MPDVSERERTAEPASGNALSEVEKDRIAIRPEAGT
jgi:hypothetical protein